MNSYISTVSKLSKDVISRIKGFDRFNLTEQQATLIDELIPDENLRKRYIKNGLCE
ncbi:2598_t:CDS:1, partial [Funneliformis mosseae]